MMQNKKVLLFIISMLFASLLTGCSVNSSARPSTEYDSLASLISAYETKNFTADSEACQQFVRDLAGMIQKKDKDAVFDDWTLTDSSDPERPIYEKDVQLFGKDMHMTIVVQPKKNWVGAISLSYEGEDAFEMAGALTTACFDRFGGTYQSLQNSENVTDYDVKHQIETGDDSISFAAIWPKSSIKWSAMVSYDCSGDVPKLTVNVL